MRSTIKTTVLGGLLFVAPAVMCAQVDFTLDGLPVQIHSFASQGFAYSNDNNYLTMNTSQGTFAFTDTVSVFPASRYEMDARGWYESAAYRVWKRLELGTYNSRFIPIWTEAHGPASNHIYDQVVAAKFDVTRFWDLKVEGHFIDGYGSPYSFRGFYPQENPTGFKPTTDMIVIRTGFFF